MNKRTKEVSHNLENSPDMFLTSLKSRIKMNSRLKQQALFAIRLLSPLRPQTFFKGLVSYIWFIKDLWRFKQMGGEVRILDCYPCLFDRTAKTTFDAQYIYQAAWAAKRIYLERPDHHVDIGSHLAFVTQLTAFTKVEFIDIRPAEIQLEGFSVRTGSITQLPLDTASVSSISSMHVIEHIGLGRYGDPLQINGPQAACKEISRVLRPGGRAYISVPIGRPRIGFNGLYVFDAEQFPCLFDNCRVLDFAYIDCDGSFVESYDYASAEIREVAGGLDFGLGIYVLEKQ
jgi:SAM-dependent methyltransferase